MKKILAILLFFILAVSCAHAMGSAPQSGIKTGDKGLDAALREIDRQAKDPAGAKEIEKVMREKYRIRQEEINALRKRGYTLTEVYYLSLLARHSGKKVDSVAALHARDGGWGVLAQKLGVHPGDLNRLRARLHQLRKEAVREQKQEEKRIRTRSYGPQGPSNSGRGKKR